MKKCLIAVLMLTLISNLQAQKKKKVKTWTVKDQGISYKLPDSWRSDPFTSSSVCNCQGTINDNNDWDTNYLGMVVYTAEYPISDTLNRNEVWSYHFESTGTIEMVTVNGIEFRKRKGLLKNSEEENEAWQYVSVDTPESNGVYIIIYFWGPQKIFNLNEDTFISIINSVKRS